jgi:hypothetical protein
MGHRVGNKLPGRIFQALMSVALAVALFVGGLPAIVGLPTR